MRKVLLALSFAVIAAFAGEMLLVETYQDGILQTADGDPLVDTTLLRLEFSLDSNCYAVFSTGGFHSRGTMWLELDEDSLGHSTREAIGSEPKHPFDQTYMCLLNSGVHTMELRWRNNPVYPTWIKNARFQALIFLPDAGGAIMERPDGDVDADATGALTSVISRGPYVTVTGATELVDATGRVIENAITDDRVSINNLSQGTYFARKEGKTLVKIVKVD